MGIIFGSNEALEILAENKAIENNTLENFSYELFRDMKECEGEDESQFDYANLINQMDYFLNIENITENPDLCIEVLRDAKFFVTSLKSFIGRIENFEKITSYRRH